MTRKAVPKATKDAILKEFNHRCAICGGASPHLHHIDENPANNEPSNLLPLCPNCHLLDQHNPTSRHDPKKLTIFRRYKDPAILSPEFQALFDRLSFLFGIDDLHTQHRLSDDITDFLRFFRCLKMGEYYADRIGKLLKVQPYELKDASLLIEFEPRPGATAKQTQKARLERRLAEQAKEREWAEAQRAVFDLVRDEVLRLTVEALRFQDWNNTANSNAPTLKRTVT